jgi:hypothetical protein
MPGGLLQLVGVGAQNQFINGNPSMTYFNAMYKRSTNFAMEHFRLDFRGVDLNLTSTGNKTFRCKIPRYADMLHDCYLCVNIPDIYSPISIDNGVGPSATPYEFQWIKNLGYNMIQEVSLLINGSAIITMTGEWMKVLNYLKYNRTKRSLIDEMVGNVPELYDPANAYNRTNQYPNAIQSSSSPTPPTTPAPSIPGRQLNIPLPFWFCENIGQSLPLVALTEAEVEISVTFRNIYQLFTVIDVRDNNNPNTPSTFGQRIPGAPQDNFLGIQNFLSPPDFFGNPTNTSLQNWNLNPYIEANYIFLTETERAHVAGFERTYLITQPRLITVANEYGLNQTLIPMFNLCTRVIALFQRTDRALLNDWDNYTNWESPDLPITQATTTVTGPPLTFWSSGNVDPLVPAAFDILQEGNLTFDGKDRFTTKNSNFFRLIENYKFTSGDTIDLPGIYQYSFALDPADPTQPSGTANGSMFNKTYFNYTLQVPPVDPALVNAGLLNNPPVCVVKSTVFNPVPTPVPANATVSPGPGLPSLFQPGQTIQLYNPVPTNGMIWQYNGTIYVESYNFLKVTSGTANLVFST